MEKMTIHRALAELKLIDSRIEKGIASIKPTGMMQKDRPVVSDGYYEKEVFEKDAKAKLQSVTDLIERKSKIKSAIVAANGITEVEVAGKEMTIADAINHKTAVEFQKRLISSLRNKHVAVVAGVEENNEKVEADALRLAEAALSKDNVKIDEKDALAITEPFLEKNRFHLVDPLKVDETTEKLEKEIDEFEAEVDAALSEINAVTFIEF